MKLSKFRIAAAATVLIVLAPAVAFAVSPFTDIIPGKFYEAPVEWALDNGITNGKSATTFEPDSPVTRGETVTFLKRYNDNVVKQTVGSLTCTTGKIAVFDGTDWQCGDDQAGTNTDTMAGLACTADQIAHYDGTDWTCKSMTVANRYIAKTTQTPDSDGYVGHYTSIVKGTDNLPIISYYDATNADLKVFHCTAADCSTGTAVTLDSIGPVGLFTSIAIGTDNYPIISYQYGWVDDPNKYNLKAYHCTAVDCSTGTAVTLESTNDIGMYTSIAVGTDGYPIISYYDDTNEDLRAYHCTAVDCSTGSSVSLDETGNVGVYTSIAVGTDNYPIISYQDYTNADLKIYHCTATDCSTGTAATLVHVDGVGHGQWTALVIGPDGYPIISHRNQYDGHLQAYHCTATDCSTGTDTLLDDTVGAGQFTSIAIGTDQLAVISYYENGGRDLRVYQCLETDCSSGEIVAVDTDGDVGRYTSIAIGANGNPIISYFDSTNTTMKVTQLEPAPTVVFG